MTELERFNKVWNGHFQATRLYGHETRQTKRNRQTQERYENILFSLWKNHRDWKDEDGDDGFQINCKEDRTIYRVRELAEKAELLIMVKNYSVGNHTRTYHKNNVLFDLIFRNEDNKYGNWLNQIRIINNRNKDIINNKYIDELNNLKISYVDTRLKKKIPPGKLKRLNYDIEKLYQLSNTMLPHYHKLLLKLNKSITNEKLKILDNFNPDDFKLKSFLYFDQDGLPKGRPWSYFCSTLNDNKKHKRIDSSFEYRSEFLKMIGLSDYYEVYDIKSEIPRINWLFHTGEWKDDGYDFYTEIIKDAEFDKYLDWNLDRGETKYTDYEDSMKQLFMRIYFGKRSDKDSYNGYLKDKMKRGRKDGEDFLIAQDEGFELNYDLWTIICNSTRKICGAPIGNLIFWYAFFIETEVKIELLKRGKKVYNVYDGFYYNQDIKDEIIDILDVKSKYVYNKYMKSIRSL
jgi:hypothetical protein